MSVYDDLIKHRIFLQRLGIGQAEKHYREIIKLLSRVDKLIKSSRKPFRVRELRTLSNQIKNEINKQLQPMVKKDLTGFAQYETKFNHTLLNKQQELKGRIVMPSENIIKDILEDRSMKFNKDGKKYTIKEGYGLLAGVIANDLYKKIRNTEAEIVKSEGIVDLMKALVFNRSKVMGVTAVNHISSQSLIAIYNINTDIIERIRWDTMLDDNVCPVCEELEGKEWESGEETDEPPLHASCRCVLAPTVVFDRNSSSTTRIKG